MSPQAQHDNDALTLPVLHPPLVEAQNSLCQPSTNDAHSTKVGPRLPSTPSSLADSLLTQLRVHITQPAPPHDSLQVDADQDTHSRPGSSTSCLDPYYFSTQSPSDSPAQDSTHPSVTPETRTHNNSVSPLTPARDPANIDRNGLVGVGELSTPRWGKLIRHAEENPGDDDDNSLGVLQEEDSTEVVVPNGEPDGPDSPWTIEAVDGELDEQDQVGFSFQAIWSIY